MVAPGVLHFGRRGVLLHLSGIPRRVAATKLITSKRIIILSLSEVNVKAQAAIYP